MDQDHLKQHTAEGADNESSPPVSPQEENPQRSGWLKSFCLLFPPMALISTFDFGASFIFDLPQSLAIAFDQQLQLDDSKCLLFYSAYSFPNLSRRVGAVGRM